MLFISLLLLHPKQPLIYETFYALLHCYQVKFSHGDNKVVLHCMKLKLVV